MNLSAATVTLLSKVLDPKAVRDALTVGKHVVDETVTLHVSGTVTVGEDFEQRLVAKADPWALLAVALSKLNGVTVDALVREAQETPAKEIEGVKKQAESAITAITETTWSTCKGKVTVNKAASLEVVSTNAGLAVDAA